MYKFFTIISLLFFSGISSGKTKDFILQSPNQQIRTKITVGNTISYELFYKNKQYLKPSRISLTLDAGVVFGQNVTILSTKINIVNKVIYPIYGIASQIKENYKELEVKCKGNYSVLFRLYNEGFAYRFTSNIDKEVLILSEKSEFAFADNYKAYFHPSLSESNYRLQQLSDQLKPDYSSLPLLVKSNDQTNILIHESDVLNFPCLTVKSSDKANLLIGEHAAYPKKVVEGGYKNFNLNVVETEKFIAKTNGKRSFPWRIVAFESNDKNILSNQLVYLLASESRIGTSSWIKPGKVVWDWWNSLNLTGVNFKTGFNTETYKHLIDFAAANKIEYINLDEGWSNQYNLMKLADNLDIKALMEYARKKNVGIILWCVWHVLDKQMIEALDVFQHWGVAGLKVDFMDRDDQVVVEFHERLLKETAKRKLLVNYHGAYHPTGMARTYPNNINVEGVKGLEWNKFDTAGTSPDHDVTIPFIRMFAGGMDYTPGAMQNYNKADWKQIFDRPMSQGTLAHQLAMYTVYYAPLQMISDAPSAYEKEPKILSFIAAVPTVWDETVPLISEIGSYVAVARRKNDTWFIGAMTGWNPKDLVLKLDFLTSGKSYSAEIIGDGINAARVGSDYQISRKKLKHGDTLAIEMAPGGGWTCRIDPEK
ncbi:alpha-glucosidase [Pedobacter sp. AK017]|uniref:glycoside hydrolase family 97 protein n=1 Tax=Pedobacter sp. AK017 TaxID=2723073 RepID=UPI00161C512E|nr:glycoside hydrolase family 97 protein [Pedobacter sp. AK017]MBB5441193.1 alpha-glucosidase [Pedobacter sp. AK017]